MRRKYYKTQGRKKIQMEALLNMQKARREIDPVLLEQAQQAIAEAWFSKQDSAPDEAKKSAADDNAQGMVKVDLKQNLNVIKKFIEMNADNMALQQQIKSMISEQL